MQISSWSRAISPLNCVKNGDSALADYFSEGASLAKCGESGPLQLLLTGESIFISFKLNGLSEVYSECFFGVKNTFVEVVCGLGTAMGF